MIFLNKNENILGSSKKVHEIIKQNIKGTHLYPEFDNTDLEIRIAKFHNVDISNVFVGNGIDEINFLISRIIPDNSIVLSHEYTYIAFQWVVNKVSTNATIKLIPLDNSHELDVDNFCKQIKEISPNVIYICNPNNPTGICIGSNEIDKIISTIKGTNIILIIDEAYIEYANTNHPTKIPYIESANIFVLRTFSKIYGLAGLRIGYTIANKELINKLQNLRKCNPYSINRFARKAAIVALDDQKHIKYSSDYNTECKLHLYKILEKHNICYFKSDTNFICVQTNNLTYSLHDKLHRSGICIRSLDLFNMDGYHRISIGSIDQINEIDKILSGIN